MRFDVLTLFPEIFAGYVSQSLIGKAVDRGLVSVWTHNIRDWANSKHHRVDDRPYGGGPGMILRVEPVVECVESVRGATDDPGHLVILTPQGKKLDQHQVQRLASHPRILLICGRYEGFDQRILDILQPEELSIGDYVVNGGEVAAMVVMDAVIRLLPGVLGDEQSHQQDSFSSDQQRLEFSQYTRPRSYRGHEVPEVLLSGDHQRIAHWRDEQSRQRTQERRSDLII